jgi:hypothetical protein
LKATIRIFFTEIAGPRPACPLFSPKLSDPFFASINAEERIMAKGASKPKKEAKKPKKDAKTPAAKPAGKK